MFSINVHPHPSMLGKAYADFVHIVSYHYYYNVILIVIIIIIIVNISIIRLIGNHL